MEIIYELLDGTIPSRPLTLTIDMERFGVVFTVHALRFEGTQARRTIFEQCHTGGKILVRSVNNVLVALAHDGQWNESISFRIVGCRVQR